MESTSESRDQPVLETIVRAYDESGPGVSLEQIEAATGLPQEDVQRALRALMHEDPPFFTTSPLRASGHIMMIRQMTGRARRTVGSWPTPEGLDDRIIAALQDAADAADTPEEQKRPRKAADAIGGIGKGVVTHMLANGV